MMAGTQHDTHAAFFYGTLMAREVFSTVCYRGVIDPDMIKRIHPFQSAILHGYCRRRVKYADYPGITPDAEHNVRGVYVTGLTNQNMDALDTFEGSEYKREKVKVRLLRKVGDDSGQGNIEEREVECEVYVYKHPTELEDREWDFHEFRTQKMRKWTRADFGFDDVENFEPVEDQGDEKAGEIPKLAVDDEDKKAAV